MKTIRNDRQAWCIQLIVGSNGLPDGNQFRHVRSVAVSRSGDISVLDRADEDIDRVTENDRVHIFQMNGGHKFKLHEARDINDVAALPNGHHVVASFNGVNVFDGNGSYLRSVYLLPSDYARRSSSYPLSVDVNGNDIFIGDDDPRKITALNGSDGVVIGSFPLRISPFAIAVSGSLFSGKIAVCDFREVDVVQGGIGELRLVFTLSKFFINGEDVGKPQGIVFDRMENLYVAVASVTSGGHVHVYSPSGEYLGCIFKGIKNPGGMAYVGSESESLFVADQTSVIKLTKQ